MDTIELWLVHKGERVWAKAEYETDISFDGDGPVVMLSSVSVEGRGILKEIGERETEQLEAHIHSLLRQDALDRAEAAWVSNREGA